MRTIPVWRHVRERLSVQVAIMVVAILVLTVTSGFFAVQLNLHAQIERHYEQQALTIARAVAADDGVGRLVAGGRPGGPLERYAAQWEKGTGAAFVVITDARGIRYTHPNPRLVGVSINYPDAEPASEQPFRTGREWSGTSRGTLGEEAVGKAPLRRDGKLMGEVSVGFTVDEVGSLLGAALPSLITYLLLVLAVGVLAALGLARLLKKQTFGLELSEITALLQEREAMLHGIREAVVGYDAGGRVLLANDAARSLLSLPPNFAGRKLRPMLPPGRLAEIMTGEVTGSDLLAVHGDRVLVANRMPIRRGGQQAGWVVTFQDRTESEGLKRQLDQAIGLTETLRAQSHEFSNRLHTLVGLVELGHYDEAVRFVTDVSATRGELSDQLTEAIGEPKLAALVLAKMSLAAERDVRLRLTPDSRADGVIADVPAALTVVGNLIDNAIDAAAESRPDENSPGEAGRDVDLTLVTAGRDLLIRVRDTGPGVPAALRERIFTDGVSTKESVTGARRGLGLALIRQIIEREGGTISVGQDVGAVFTAVLPGRPGPPGDSGTAAATVFPAPTEVR